MLDFLTPSLLQTWLKNHQNPCLFLDIDGTLAPFTLSPADSKIPDNTLKLIKKLQCIGVPVAIITGRSLTEARQMLTLENTPLDLPIGATHGLEIAFSADATPVVADFILQELPLITSQIHTQLHHLNLNHLLVEKKPYSVALHYRKQHRQQPDLAEITEKIMQNVVQNFPHWQCKQGKFVWEIMPTGVDKGQAVTAIFAYFGHLSYKQRYQQKLFPIFIGDDVSDEAGFLAVQAHQGIGIKVGQTTTTHADFFVQDIDEVTQILQTIYQFYQASLHQNQPLAKSEPIR